jgi:hypothetical protein
MKSCKSGVLVSDHRSLNADYSLTLAVASLPNLEYGLTEWT